MVLRETEGGESHDVADALAKSARGAVSLTAMQPSDKPEGGLGIPHVRVPDGDLAPYEGIHRGFVATQGRGIAPRPSN